MLNKVTEYNYAEVLINFKKKEEMLYNRMNIISHDIYGNSPYYSIGHAEGSIWAHTMMVCNNLINTKRSMSLELFLSALLHDVGKAYTAEAKLVENKDSDNSYYKQTFYNHPQLGSLLAYDILKNMYGTRIEALNVQKIIELINLHMFFHINFGTVVNGNYYLNVDEERKVNAIFSKRKGLFYDLRALIKADALGRITNNTDYYTTRSKDLRLKAIGEHFKYIKPKEEKDPIIVFLIGLPGTGKTTYRKEFKDYTVISFDDIVEAKANELKIPYRDMFNTEHEEILSKIDNILQRNFDEAISKRQNIIIDKTNLSTKSRRKFLSRLPFVYYKKAVVFIRGLQDIYATDDMRSKIGRNVGLSNIFNMAKKFNVPTHFEFDKILYKF